MFSFVEVGASDETRSGEGGPCAMLSQTGIAWALGNLVTGEHSDAFSLWAASTMMYREHVFFFLLLQPFRTEVELRAAW